MIDASVLSRVSCGVCAIGYLTVPKEQYLRDPTQPFFKVVGTGFLVRDNMAMTNRHVIQALLEAQQETGFPKENKLLTFVYPGKPEMWHTTICEVIWEGFSLAEHLDLGFVEFNRSPVPEFGKCLPLALGDLSMVSVGHPVATCGYPYGTALLRRGGRGKIYRFGPILQQGYVSAIAPYDASSSRVEELLLDLRAAGGMSGSPVFRPEDGTVIGIIYATWEATAAVAVPLDANRLQQLLQIHDKARSGGSGTVVEGKVDHVVRRQGS